MSTEDKSKPVGESADKKAAVEPVVTIKSAEEAKNAGEVLAEPKKAASENTAAKKPTEAEKLINQENKLDDAAKGNAARPTADAGKPFDIKGIL